MATVAEAVFPEAELYRAAVYTGENSMDLNSLIDDFTITGETATTLSFTSAGTPYTVPRNAYIVWRDGAVTDTFLNEEDFRDNFGSVASASAHYHEVVLMSGPAIAGAAA